MSLAIRAMFFLLGLHLVYFENIKNHNDFFGHYLSANEASFFEIQIISEPEEKDKTIQFKAEVLTLKKHKSTQQTKGRSVIFLRKNKEAKNLQYGDQLLVKGRMKAIETIYNPGGFDYEKYMASQHIYYQLFADTLDWIKTSDNNGNILKHLAINSRNNIIKYLSKNGLEDRELAIANALLLGDKSLLNRDQKETYSTAGAMHVLAVSGLHVGVVLLILQFLLKPLRKMRWFYAVLLIVGIWTFALLTGFSPSVIRAATMFSFIGIGGILYRKNNIYHTIFASAFVLLIIQPSLLFNVGFQLSYIAVLGIVYLQPKIYNSLYVKNRWLDLVWKITAVSIAAQIATFPISAYYFHIFPTYFIITNLLVIPLAWVILSLSSVILITSWLPFVGEILTQLLQWVIWIMNESISWVETLPYSKVDAIRFNLLDTFLLYLSFIIIILAWKKSEKKWKWAAVVSVFLFFGQRFYFSFQQHHKKEWIVFHARKSSASAFVQGHHSIYLHEGKPSVSDEYLKSGLKSAYGLLSMESSSINDQVYQYLGLNILFYKEYLSESINKIAPDYIILNNDQFIPYKSLQRLNYHPIFILDGSNSYYYKKTIKGILKSLKLKYYDTKEDGALVVSL